MSGKCSDTGSDSGSYSGDTDWAACLVATNQNERNTAKLQCPHNFPRLEDHGQDCKPRSSAAQRSKMVKRVCCLLQPTISAHVSNPLCKGELNFLIDVLSLC